MANWYYSRQGSQVGPIAREQLDALARSGALWPDDLVWTDGMPNWQPARAIADLAAIIPPGRAPVGYYGGPPPPYSDGGQDAGMRMLLPVGRSGWAIAAGYLGLFSVLFVFAPFALIAGIFAVRDIRSDSTKHGMGRAIFGIVMGALFTIGLIVMIVTVVG
jgi:hypothetical protein